MIVQRNLCSLRVGPSGTVWRPRSASNQHHQHTNSGPSPPGPSPAGHVTRATTAANTSGSNRRTLWVQTSNQVCFYYSKAPGGPMYQVPLWKRKSQLIGPVSYPPLLQQLKCSCVAPLTPPPPTAAPVPNASHQAYVVKPAPPSVVLCWPTVCIHSLC